MNIYFCMIDLILKQLGLSPASIKKQVDDAAQNFASVVKHFDERFNQLEKIIKENNGQETENCNPPLTKE